MSDLIRVRLTADAYRHFNGELAAGTRFEKGVSVDRVHPRIAHRIGASLHAVDDDTGEQLGPAAQMLKMRGLYAPVAAPIETADMVYARQRAEAEAEAARQKSEEQLEAERVAAEVEALATARAKAEAETPQVFTKLELEQLGGDKGIGALRDIGEPIGAKGRSVNEMIVSILRQQARKLADA